MKYIPQEKQLKTETIYNGIIISTGIDTVTLPDGSQTVREWVNHPGGVAILPLFPNGDIMLIQQYRYVLRQSVIEVPAGKIEPQENHQQTAKRELEEETGWNCHHLESLGYITPSVGYTNEHIHLFLARELTPITNPKKGDEFFVQQIRMPIKTAVKQIMNNTIYDAKTIAIILKTWLKYDTS